jgi:putative ABC transport system permease protein
MYEALARIPGVESVAASSFPIINSLVSGTTLVAPTDRSAQALNATYFLVTPQFFAAMRIPLLSGRDVADTDTPDREWVAIINEEAARTLWPGENPLGHTLKLTTVPWEPPRRVIAIVPNIPPTRRATGPRPIVYTSYLQQPARYTLGGAGSFGRVVFMLRSTGDPWALLPGVRQAIDSIDPDRALDPIATMEQRLGRGEVGQSAQYVATVLLFAVTAMLLAAIGIYGIVAYAAAQRTPEIGIRVVLGAGAREVITLVGREAIVVIAVGLAGGLVAALALTRLLEPQLWGVTSTDPLTIVSMAALLLLTAFAASFMPVRRALRIDPAVVLRNL